MSFHRTSLAGLILLLTSSLTWAGEPSRFDIIFVPGHYDHRGRYVDPHFKRVPSLAYHVPRPVPRQEWVQFRYVSPELGVAAPTDTVPEFAADSVAIPSFLTPFPGGLAFSEKLQARHPQVAMTEGERRHAEQVREGNRRESLILAEKGMAYYNAGEFLSAAAEYGWAIDRDPTNVRLYYCRGIMFNRLGRFDDAIPDLLAALQIDPAFREAQTALAYAMSRRAEWNVPPPR